MCSSPPKLTLVSVQALFLNESKLWLHERSVDDVRGDDVKEDEMKGDEAMGDGVREEEVRADGVGGRLSEEGVRGGGGRGGGVRDESFTEEGVSCCSSLRLRTFPEATLPITGSCKEPFFCALFLLAVCSDCSKIARGSVPCSSSADNSMVLVTRGEVARRLLAKKAVCLVDMKVDSTMELKASWFFTCASALRFTLFMRRLCDAKRT